MNGTLLAAAAALVLSAVPVNAQLTKTVPLKMEMVTATVDAIDFSNRQVSVTKSDKTHEVLYVPTAIKRFDTLKVGDRITAKYYENIVLQVKAPGATDVNKNERGIVRPEGASGATASHQRTITATIAAIDPNLPSITFTGPNDWKYTTRVKDKEALGKVKVGDRVEITWTEALILSLEDAK